MAIGLTNDDATNSIPRIVTGNDQTTYTCNSGGSANDGLYTPAATTLLVAMISTAGTSVDPTSVTGHGVTYTKIAFSSVTNLNMNGFYAADSGGSPTNAALQMTFAATATGACLYDLNFSGVDLSGGVAAAIVQSVLNTDIAGTATSLQTTLAAASAVDNRPAAMCVLNVNQTITEDTNYVEINDQGHTLPARRLSASWQSGGFDVTIDHSWSAGSSVAVRAFEIKAAAAGGGGSTVLDPFGMSGFFGG
jgi:hypothetical protein